SELVSSLLNGVKAHVALLDRDGQIVATNVTWRQFARDNDARQNTDIGDDYLAVVRRSAEDGAPRAADALEALEGALAQRVCGEIDYPCHGEGERRWFRVRYMPLDDGHVGAIHENITAARLTSDTAERFAAALDHSHELVLLVDGVDGRIIHANATARQRIGRDLENTSADDLVDNDAFGWWKPTGNQSRQRVFLVDTAGARIPAEVTTSQTHDGIIAVVARDITEQIQLERRLTHKALHDELTGLANRSLFLDRIRRALDQGKPGCVIYIDLDDFKAINDTHGHSVGDKVLEVVASRMQSSLRDSDTPARLGGDEFGVLLTEAPPEIARRITARLLEGIKAPIETEAGSITVAASAGIARLESAPSAEALIDRADSVMYEVKDRGGDQFDIA
ncbi:MAG: diguanylate cyclase, partial [Phycisphaeraceae bacterium]|nr:diguanylate cyclase [Phycisphaeraceae bacterium]